MKLSGIAGTGSGKLGSQVYASVAGEQIVRNYQPKVSNPNTTKQVNQRSRFKLMSQLSAAMASVIVIPKEGMRSSRNLFSKKNADLVKTVGGQALCFLERLQLTNGTSALPRVGISRADNHKLDLFLQNDATGVADRVVYNLFARSEEGDLMLINSVVVETPGEENDFPVTVEDYDGDLFVYAYGMKDLNQSAKAKYGNYMVQTGEDIAKLLMTRTISTSDYNFTETQGNSITFDETDGVVVPEGSICIRCHMLGDGVVRQNSAAGNVVNFPVVQSRGRQRKWLAVAAPGYTFDSWQVYQSDENWMIKKDNPLTFTAWSDIDMVVDFGGSGDLD